MLPDTSRQWALLARIREIDHERRDGAGGALC
jgi:hypothetical protein